MARLLDTTPKQDGFRLPGEFEAKSGCWLGWPERTDGGPVHGLVWSDPKPRCRGQFLRRYR